MLSSLFGKKKPAAPAATVMAVRLTGDDLSALHESMLQARRKAPQ